MSLLLSFTCLRYSMRSASLPYKCAADAKHPFRVASDLERAAHRMVPANVAPASDLISFFSRFSRLERNKTYHILELQENQCKHDGRKRRGELTCNQASETSRLREMQSHFRSSPAYCEEASAQVGVSSQLSMQEDRCQCGLTQSTPKTLRRRQM
jgi:hypothetical protein